MSAAPVVVSGDAPRSVVVEDEAVAVVPPDSAPDAELVRRHLLAEISSGRLAVGAKVGSERQLADTLGVSRAVVRQVLAGFAAAGLVRRVTGRAGGTFVSRLRIDRDATALQSTPQMLREQGVGHECVLVSVEVRPSEPGEQQALELPEHADVLAVVRVRLADGTPLSMERTVLSADRFPDLIDKDLTAVYSVLEDDFGVTVQSKTEQVEVVGATREEAHHLKVAVGSPLLASTVLSRSGDGVPIDYSCDVYRADRTRIVVCSSGQAGARGSVRTSQAGEATVVPDTVADQA